MIIITGITGGIGNFLFNKFSQSGEQIIGTYHLNKPEGEIYKNTVQLDITNFVEVEKFIASISNNYGYCEIVYLLAVRYKLHF